MEDYITRVDIIEQQDKEFEESLRIDRGKKSTVSVLDHLNSESIEQKRERIAKSYENEQPQRN